MRAALPAALLPLLMALLAPGCAGVDGLSGTPPALSTAEQASVRSQVDKAMAAGRFNEAWNQEVAAGADRARLERIATTALEQRSRHAGDMFAALRDRHGGLSPEARGLVTTQRQVAEREGHWMRAVQIELMTADDPPAYEGAWAVYRAAPPDQASDLLKAITEAKQAHAESAD